MSFIFFLLHQNNHPHGQPYTGPAAQHMNNPQRPGPATAPAPGPSQTPTPAPGPTPGPGPRAQETWESTEEVTPAPASTPAPAPPKEAGQIMAHWPLSRPTHESLSPTILLVCSGPGEVLFPGLEMPDHVTGACWRLQRRASGKL
ncbi:putative ubiquitin carboxyl-terminal hydrolase FAF-X [Merluccius polli]|uniref:Ubiquitin carboxyl-terminal hydrolase FAF-X n=1 Tax=Merluccius polli TaxID=89951 RepID=A0AA47M2H2_MERPO|nr:putative ubiquitin carboxyl-terminal hydrolase FAF-X [Merluccius polli]